MRRNELRTGLLVILTVGVLITVLIYLGAPGAFVKQRTYLIYFDNAAGVRPGARVLVAGRQVGQVSQVFSPVAESERPEPKYESLVEVRMEAATTVYRKVRVEMRQLTMLSDMVIDFTNGEESSGVAPERTSFLGVRQPGVAEIVPLVLDKIDPAIRKTTEALDTLQRTAANLDTLTAEGADFPLALAEFRIFGSQLNELTASGGPLRRSMENLELLTQDDGPLAKALRNAEEVTAKLAGSDDLVQTLENARRATENLDRLARSLGPRLDSIGDNLEQATDTIKRQPWRLVWPSTKKYEEPEAPRPTPVRPRTSTRKR